MTTTAPQATTHRTASADPAPAVVVHDLSHVYPALKPRRARGGRSAPAAHATDRAALEGVSLEVRPGEVFGLLGPNGSGKSTLFRILATVQQALPPAGAKPGSAAVFGTDIHADPAGVRAKIGVVFQHPSLDDKLTAAENLRYHGMLHGITGSTLAERSSAMLASVGLDGRAGERVEAFSGGMRRRVEIAKALLPSPRLLLMDEASTGLDPAAQRDLWATLRERVRDDGLTVLLTTHLMHEAALCDRLAVLSQGRVITVDTPTGLVERVGGQVLEVQWDNPVQGGADGVTERVLSALGLSPGSPGVTSTNQTLRVEMADAAGAVPRVAELAGDRAASIRVAQPTLEDAYLSLTGQPLYDAGA
jgi:ABC-2 type transport system ATP-binding protein